MAGRIPSQATNRQATNRVANTFATLTTLATALSALILTAVIIGNILLLVFKIPTSLALFILVDIGPVLGVFLSNIGNGGTYYGVWRVLRRAEAFDLGTSTKSYGGNVPGMLQWAPEALAGCFPLAAGFVLALSLIMTVLTFAPAPIHTLGITLHSSGGPSANTAGVTSENSSGSSSGGSNSGSSGGTTTTHFTVTLGTNNTATQACETATTALAPLAVSLQNSGTSSVRWNVTNVDGISSTNPTPWAALSSATGTVAAGQTDTLTLTPSTRLCSEIGLHGATYHVVAQVAGVGAFTLADQVSAPPQLSLALNTTSVSQTCSSFYSALPGISVTLDNTRSNVAANWQLSGVQLIPGTSHPWASAGAGSGSVAAGQSGTITLSPDPKLCYWSPLPSKTYHATLSWSAGKAGAAVMAGSRVQAQSVTITDTVTSPPLPTPLPSSPPPPPSTPPPPPVMWLGATPLNNTQSCSTDGDGNPSLQPYQVTLANSGSYAINWTFSATQPVSATDSAVWATTNPASGSVPPGAMAQFTVTPDADICDVDGNPSYSATLTQSGNGQQGPTQTLTDGIGVPAFASFTLSPNPQTQTCKEGSVSSYTLTIDNTKSNVPFTWSLSNVSTTSSGAPWVKLQGGGTQTIGAGAKQQITIAPDPSVCLVSGTMTYTADISATSPNGKTSYGTQQLKDAITVPVSMSLTPDRANHADYCDNEATDGVGPTPYPVTLTNNSNVSITWSFSSVDEVNGQPWATFTDAHTGKVVTSGALQPYDEITLTVTPYEDSDHDQGVCSTFPEGSENTATYNANITYADASDSSQTGTTSFSDTFWQGE